MWSRPVYVALICLATFSLVVHAANHSWGWMVTDLGLLAIWVTRAIATDR